MASKAIENVQDTPLFPVKRDLFKELENASGSVETWKPEVGSMVVGVLLERQKWETENGPADVAIIAREDKDGEKIAVFLNSLTLWKRWEEEYPRLFDRVGIKLCAKETSKTGREYNVYALVVDRNPVNYPVISEVCEPATIPTKGIDLFVEQ